MGDLLVWRIFTHPWSPYEWQASNIWPLRDSSSWSCTLFLFSSSCWCLEDTHESSLNFLIQDILVTWFSLFSSSYNIEANIWFKHFLWTHRTNITQCKYYSIRIAIDYQIHAWGLHALSHVYMSLGFGNSSCNMGTINRPNSILAWTCMNKLLGLSALQSCHELQARPAHPKIRKPAEAIFDIRGSTSIYGGLIISPLSSPTIYLTYLMYQYYLSWSPPCVVDHSKSLVM
jgi:hypothetical protein